MCVWVGSELRVREEGLILLQDIIKQDRHLLLKWCAVISSNKIRKGLIIREEYLSPLCSIFKKIALYFLKRLRTTIFTGRFLNREDGLIGNAKFMTSVMKWTGKKTILIYTRNELW